MNIIHISYAGPERILMVEGKKFLFEDHHYCGPVVLGKNGDPLSVQPSENSPFWSAVSLWYQQGKRINETVNPPWCIWDKPKIQNMRHIGGNNYVLENK